MTKPIVARSRRAAPILVCKKCLKRAPEGADIKRELKRVLKAQQHGKLKRPRLVSTSCFGICPKKAIVLASGDSLQRGEYVLVSRRSEIEDAFRLLLPTVGPMECK